MGNKYIYNKNIAPITVNARDRKGAVLFTKPFQPERIDGTTGRVVSTGYTILTDEEYEHLTRSSRTFTHYKDRLGLLVVCDDLPPEAKTPQEALVDARKKTREAQARVSELEAENGKLKADLRDAKEGLGRLVSASTPKEVLKPFEDKIASLEKDREAMKESIEKLVKERDTLRAELAGAGKQGAVEKAGKGGKGKEFD
jgi:regulator of replication initiation timing